MMKKTLMIFWLLLTFLGAQAQSFTPPAEGKTVVYFIRISSWGSLVDFAYFDRDKYIGKFNGRKYLRYECDPGEHLLWVRAENRDFVEANLEAGKIYLLEPVPQMGMMKAGAILQTIDMKDPSLKEKVMKVMAKPPVTATEEELAARAEKYKDEITKGLAKYKDEKAAGKSMLQLKKDMFYTPE